MQRRKSLRQAFRNDVLLARDSAVKGFPVLMTCGALGFPAQAFYVWNKNPVTAPVRRGRALDQRTA